MTGLTACPTNAQVVLQKSSSCQATGDNFGNLGVYVLAGTYQYTMTSGGKSYGPYTITLSGGVGGIGSVSGTPYEIASSGGTNPFLSFPSVLKTPGSINAIAIPCSEAGATADVQIRNACTNQLPAGGGTMDLSCYGATTQTIANSITGCMSPTKIVTFFSDNMTKFNITESDGGTVFPLDNNGSVLGPGLGQGSGCFELASSANVTAIFGPAHTDMTQEDLTVKGICARGHGGATVGKGLVYVGGIGGTNTAIADNYLFACNTACLWMENSGGGMKVSGNEMNVAAGDNTIIGSALVVYAFGGGGLRIGDLDISGPNFEHANGPGQSNIKVFNDGSGAWVAAVNIHNIYLERNYGAGSTPDEVSLLMQDCWDCKIDSVAGGGGDSVGTDFIKVVATVSPTASGETRNVQLSNISLPGAVYTNILNDGPDATLYSASIYPSITQKVILPGLWDSAPNAALVNPGPDILGGAGLFSGTGTTYTGWSEYYYGLTSGEVTAALNASDPPNAPTIAGGTSSQDITIGANSLAAYAGAAGVQTAASYGMTAGYTYTISLQARVVSGSYNIAQVDVGNGSDFNCAQQAPEFFLGSAWATYSFQCTAVTTENIGINVSFVSSSASATGEVAIGNIQIIPLLGGVPGELAQWTTDRTLGALTGPISVAGTAPTVSSNAGTGSVTHGTDNAGIIATGATSTATTLTFNVGWATWASCTVSASTATALPYVSAISKSAVTFTYVTTGTPSLYYGCFGQ
jgi:hypothetical protein